MATDIGMGVLYEQSTTGSGTGSYNSFLRLQANGDEEGFNTDQNNLADNKNGVWTHSLLISDLQAIDAFGNGTLYYEIRLDLNENDSGSGPNITLEELRLFTSDSPAVGADYANDFADLTEVFDLGASLALVDVNSGSGTDDYRILIPKDLLDNGEAYFTLYSEFSGSDGGFEEWRALASESAGEDPPAITVVKEANPTVIDEGTPTDIVYTYTLTSQSEATDPLLLDTLTDDAGTPGDPGDDIDLLEGFVVGSSYGLYYQGGDTDLDYLLDSDETWTFEYTRTGLELDPGEEHTNTVSVTAFDDEATLVTDEDDATVTGQDVLPEITVVKVADKTVIPEGTPTDVVYTYTLTSQSVSSDPLTITSLIDDNGTAADTSDDIDLLADTGDPDPLGDHYVSGDLNDNQLLDSDEEWVFEYTRAGVVLNAGEELTNVVAVTAEDDEGNEAGDDDDETVTGEDLDPDIGIVKTASLTSIQAGLPTPVTFTYEVTNESAASTDPITLTSLVDDNGTVDTADDQDLLDGFVFGADYGLYYDSGDDGDYLLEKGETWVFKWTTDLTLDPGETRTNVAAVTGVDDEDNEVSAIDDAAVTAYNLGRTPGFWSNNGSLLWDGDTGTFPKAGGLGIVDPGEDLAYGIYDLDGDGSFTDDGFVDSEPDGEPDGPGNTGYLMIGDWDKDGVADLNENVLVISRADALSLLNASQKDMGDARQVLARDAVASWLNFLGGSYVGTSDDPDSAMHYIDEATAWLIQTTNGDHVLTKLELGSGKVAQKTAPWQLGFNGDGDATPGENQTPAAGEHDIGPAYLLDIMSGSAIHAGLDHYNNFGFV